MFRANDSLYAYIVFISSILWAMGISLVLDLKAIAGTTVVLWLASASGCVYLLRKKTKLMEASADTFSLSRKKGHIILDFCSACTAGTVLPIITYAVKNNIDLLSFSKSWNLINWMSFANIVAFAFTLYLYSQYASNERSNEVGECPSCKDGCKFVKTQSETA